MKKIVYRSDYIDKIPESEKAKPDSLLRALFMARGEASYNAHDYQLKNLYPPELLKGASRAAEILYKALQQQKKISIVGDFDTDGATSTALLARCLSCFGHSNFDFVVPNRFDYGYGLTPEIVDLVSESRPDLIVTVDNGISSIDGVARAHALGIPVLVTDHHLPGKILPEAEVIVNPNQNDCEFPSKCLAGVGVIFYVMLALRKKLREENWFQEKNISEPNLAQFLDLVALGTVADLVPLDMNNRILVAQGIKRIQAGLGCQGISALVKIAGREDKKVNANDFGFIVGPRLNAAGRLDDMEVGIRCLLADDQVQALGIAQELDSLNKERRAIEGSMQVEAEKDIAALTENTKDLPAICVYREDWHQGVVGIVASRIKEKTHRPAIVFAHVGNSELKGSGRSIAGIHLRDVLDEIATLYPGLLNKFGGHAMAAGLSIREADFAKFKQAFEITVEKYLDTSASEPVIHSDGELDAQQLSLLHAQAICDAGPWGMQFPEPVFTGKFRIADQRIVGGKHLKMLVCPGDFNQHLIDAIAFNVDLSEWPNPQAQTALLAYKLDVNEFRGKQSVQLIVDELFFTNSNEMSL